MDCGSTAWYVCWVAQSEGFCKCIVIVGLHVWGRLSIRWIFKGTVVFVLGRSGVAGQETSVSAAEVAGGKCDVGQDTETVSDLKL